MTRPQEPLLPGGEHHGLALVEGVVAGRDGVGPGVDDGAQDVFRDAEPAGGVLAVDDDEIERVIGDEPGKLFDHGIAARAADDISQKQQSHALLSLPLRRRPAR